MLGVNMRIFDAHCDTVLRIVDEVFNVGVRATSGHVDIPRLLEGGVGCQVFACFASRDEHGATIRERSLALLSAAERLADDPRILIPRSAAELEGLARERDRLGAIITIEGGDMLQGDPTLLPALQERGVRAITIAWGDNELCGGAFGEAYGLTPAGEAVVREMTRLRMLIDLSHASDAAFDDILAATDGPVIATHSNTRSLCPTARNLTDDQVRRIAERGGVIGVTFVSGFLTREAAEFQAPFMRRAVEKARAAGGGLHEFMEEAYVAIAEAPKPPFTSFAEHVDRIVDTAGIDCVGFGSDFDGYRFGAEGIDDCTAWPRIVDLMRSRGYSETELEKLFWGNWVRVFSRTME